MKMNCWLMAGFLATTSVLAQDNTNLPPVVSAPTTPAIVAPAPATVETNAPVKKAVKRKKVAAPKKTPFVEPTVALVPGPAEVAVKNLNVRGQPGLKGEFISHVTNGESVVVISEITLDKHKPSEPAQWAKIQLPASAKVWVHSGFIDATNKTVLPKKLNLRAGPSEYYSVLGVIERGTVVAEITSKGDWTQIEAPTNAFAFVAAMYLKQEASGTLATNLPPSAETEPTPVPTPVQESQPIVTEPTNAPAIETTNAPETSPTEMTNTVSTPTETSEVDTNLPPPPPRVVTHEGVVRPSRSVIAPTDYLLYDPKTGEEIDFLYTTSTNLDISRYNNLRIVVTGEEGLAQRWEKTPVLTIQKIQVIE